MGSRPPRRRGHAATSRQRSRVPHHHRHPLKAWADADFRLWLALHLPECRIADLVDDDFNRNGVVTYTATNRATVDYSLEEDGSWPVTQDQARLWNTVEATWRLWQRYDQPERTRIGITARVDGEQWAWLERPDGPIRWPLPSQ